MAIHWISMCLYIVYFFLFNPKIQSSQVYPICSCLAFLWKITRNRLLVTVNKLTKQSNTKLYKYTQPCNSVCGLILIFCKIVLECAVDCLHDLQVREIYSHFPSACDVELELPLWCLAAVLWPFIFNEKIILKSIDDYF